MHAATSLLISVLIFLAFSLVLADSTTTVTTTIPMTTTTTIKVTSSAPLAGSTLPSLPTNTNTANVSNTLSTIQDLSCVCLTAGAWCGSRGSKMPQVGLKGTCNTNSLYLCKSDGDQTPQEFPCTKVLESIFQGEADAAKCMEAMFYGYFNDDCNMPKRGGS